jgi:membrane-associated phospholipid phosphatase
MPHTVERIAGTLALSLTLATLPSRVAAQVTPAAGQGAPEDSLIPDTRLFHRADLYVLGGFGAATAAMFPLDRHLASLVRDEDLVTNKRLKDISGVFRFFGGPGPLIIGGAMYGAGRLTHRPRVAELGVHGTEAVLVGMGTGLLLKTVLGRARPYLSADTNPNNFGLFRGVRGGSYQSFPSGHTTTAFSVAAAVTLEINVWKPGSAWIVGPLLYGGATLVGVSRMYEDKHWASDVVMGAMVGTFAGLKTVRFNHTHTGNRIDRWLLEPARTSGIHPLLGPDRIGLAGTLSW